jgi:hypothetical protein
MQSPVIPSLSQIIVSRGGVVINVIFCICFSSIICCIGKFYFDDRTGFSLGLQIIRVFKITMLYCEINSKRTSW